MGRQAASVDPCSVVCCRVVVMGVVCHNVARYLAKGSPPAQHASASSPRALKRARASFTGGASAAQGFFPGSSAPQAGRQPFVPGTLHVSTGAFGGHMSAAMPTGMGAVSAASATAQLHRSMMQAQAQAQAAMRAQHALVPAWSVQEAHDRMARMRFSPQHRSSQPAQSQWK